MLSIASGTLRLSGYAAISCRCVAIAPRKSRCAYCALPIQYCADGASGLFGNVFTNAANPAIAAGVVAGLELVERGVVGPLLVRSPRWPEAPRAALRLPARARRRLSRPGRALLRACAAANRDRRRDRAGASAAAPARRPAPRSARAACATSALSCSTWLKSSTRPWLLSCVSSAAMRSSSCFWTCVSRWLVASMRLRASSSSNSAARAESATQTPASASAASARRRRAACH